MEFENLISERAFFYIYRNLHKDCFSVKYLNKVIKYSSYILIFNPEFVVNQKGREKVLREKRKNVHAYIKTKNIVLFNNNKELYNYIKNVLKIKPNFTKEIYYNPYKVNNFILKNINKPIKKASLIIAKENKIYFLK